MARPIARVLCLLVVVCVAHLLPVSVATAQTQEIPGVEVTADLPETIHQGETFPATFEMANVGSTPYQDIVFEPEDACGPSTHQGLVEFSELQGNGDDQLDPSEVWVYYAPICLDWAVPFASAQVSANDGVATLSANYLFGYSTVPPIQAQSIGGVSADACLTRKFDVPLLVVTSSPLRVDGAFLELAIPDEWSSGEVPFAEIQQVSGNGDAIFDPGEEWLAGFFFASLSHCLTVPDPPLVLLMSMEGVNVDSGAPWCIGHVYWCSSPKAVVGTITELGAATDEDPGDDVAGEEIDPATLPLTGMNTGVLSLTSGALIGIGLILIVGAHLARRPTGGLAPK